MVDIPRYTFLAYARSEKAALIAGVLCLLGVVLLEVVLGVTLTGAALVTGFVALCMLAVFVVRYVRRAHYFNEVTSFCLKEGKLLQFGSLVEEPLFLEGLIAHEATCYLAIKANEDIQDSKERDRQYREYLELWVHEIKTPIAASKLMLSTMHGSQAGKLKRELERIDSRVEQVLYAARSTSLNNDYVIREVDLLSMVRAACKKNARLLVESGISLEFEDDADVRVFADESWFVFALCQVLSNSSKYGATALSFSVREEEEGTPRECTVLQVRDNGCGIPAADVPRVFERGFTGTVGRAHGSATGMGLYLVAALCERMGIGVELGSEEGAGTRIMFSFPHDRRRLNDSRSDGSR